MIDRRRLSALLLGSIVICTLRPNASEAGARPLYRWVDEAGNIHYSDKVPPEQAKHMRETLDKRGHTIAITEAAKSREELAAESRLQELRTGERQLLARQIEQDRALLVSYRNAEELRTAKAAKLAMLRNQRTLMDSNIQRLNEKLDTLLRRAADHERNGKAIPPTIPKEIAETRAQLEEIRSMREAAREQSRIVENQFDAEIARINALLKPSGRTFLDEPTDSAYRPGLPQGTPLAGVFPCRDEASCARAWTKAAEYVAKFSTTPVALETDSLIYTLNPKISTDIALSASRFADTDGTTLLFLDVRCTNNGFGRELCNSKRIDDIRLGFPEAVAAQ